MAVSARLRKSKPHQSNFLDVSVSSLLVTKIQGVTKKVLELLNRVFLRVRVRILEHGGYLCPLLPVFVIARVNISHRGVDMC